MLECCSGDRFAYLGGAFDVLRVAGNEARCVFVGGHGDVRFVGVESSYVDCLQYLGV